MSKNEFKPLSRKANIVTQETGNEILIYDLKINKAFVLNETSSIIWLACDGNKTVSEISNQISKQLYSPINEEFIWFALEQLKTENLIESEVPTPFEGLSRREVIWKVGLASAIALPIISSLVAPMAIHAASGSCTSGSQCPAPTSCCSNISGQPRACVTTKTPTGGICGLTCECVGNCCVSAVCSSNTVSNGNPCSSTCQCIGGRNCISGTCQ